MTHRLSTTATSVFGEQPPTLEQVQTNLVAVAALFELDEKSPIVFTFHAHEEGDSPNEFKFSVKHTDDQKLPSGSTFQYDFVIRSGNGVLAVDMNEHQIEIIPNDDTGEPCRTTGIAYHPTEVLKPLSIAGRLMAECENLLSVEAREHLGNSPHLQACDSPLAPLMRSIFPPVPFGIEQLKEAFIRLNDILQRHTNGFVESGTETIHANYQLFWCGVSFHAIKNHETGAWSVDHDRIGWTISDGQNHLHQYDTARTMYRFNDSDILEREYAEPEEEDIGPTSLSSYTAADIFGAAVDWIDNALPDGLTEAAQAEIFAIMDTFPPNPSTDQPAATTAPAPA